MSSDVFAAIRDSVGDDDLAVMDAPEAPARDFGARPAAARRRGDRATDVLELVDRLESEDKEVAMPPAVAEAPRAADGPIVSSVTALAAQNAFAALSQLQVRSAAGEENTLHGLVVDLLRPMLREWLDRELAGIVEKRVDAEVRRISAAL